MALKDLREWIALLEEKGELKRIKALVDWDEEIGAITREISSQYGPALLFEKIKDHQNTLCRRLFTNGTGARQRVCRLLGLSEQTSDRDLVLTLKERFSKPIEPTMVRQGPVKENIIRGEEIDLYQFPVPKWNPLDGGRYIMT
ncbi:MAG: UbiD family decarboxylase, partial [Deltaproteobacteria bacterium]|nr:UbiD family decarboxylase [Deltaproteobacteria bacterium]